MTTASPGYAAPAAYSVAASLAAANYDLTVTAYNSTTNKPVDVLFEYIATVAANPTGNKQIVLFVQSSLDGTNWPAPPASSTDTTRDTSMRYLGSVFTNNGASSGQARDVFSVGSVFPNGTLPPYWRVVVKNDCGVAMSSCSARTQEISLTAA